MSRLSDRALRGIAFSIAALWISIQLAWIGFDVVREADFGEYVEEFGLLVVAIGISFPAMGAVIASRQPRNAIAWIYLAVGTVSLGFPLSDYARFGLITRPGSLPGAVFASWVHNWIWFPGMALIITFAVLLFPDGRLPSLRWRFHAWGTALGLTIMTGYFARVAWYVRGRTGLEMTSAQIDALPIPMPTWLKLVTGLGELLFVAGAIGALLSLILRYRNRPHAVRQQLKWVMFAAVVTVVTFLVVILFFAEVRIPQVVTMPLVPVAAAIAILRYRLFDIDVVINKTFVYGALAAFISAVYVGVVVGVGSAVGAGGEPNLGLSLAATGFVAVAFQPVRERIQRLANRVVYGQRLSPYEAVTSFSHRMAESLSFDEVLPSVAEAAASAVGGERSNVKLIFTQGGSEEIAWPPIGAKGTDPTHNSFDATVSVVHQGTQVGEISVAKKKGEALTTSEHKLLSDLASQAGLAFSNIRLTEELKAKLVELQESRRRIVSAQDEERRRMERDIHDGAQQQLVSMSVKLGLAKSLVTKDAERAAQVLDELKAEASEAVETLRDLARGLFSQVLSDRGLIPALQAHIDKMDIPATVHADSFPRIHQQTEAAIYFVVREALQNVTKYAPKTDVFMSFSYVDGQVSFEVKDRGPGFVLSKAKLGSGLQNMRDRIEAVGGILDIESGRGEGTSIRGRIPTGAMEMAS